MQRWTTPKPLALPIDFERLGGLDLELENVRRDSGSFTAYVFLNAGEDLPADAGPDHESFAGSFSIFAARECWGAAGHCDWEHDEPVSPFDQRPEHHLSPINVTVEVTEAVKRLGNPKKLSVTIHAGRPGDPKAQEGVISFDRLTAMAYL